MRPWEAWAPPDAALIPALAIAPATQLTREGCLEASCHSDKTEMLHWEAAGAHHLVWHGQGSSLNLRQLIG